MPNARNGELIGLQMYLYRMYWMNEKNRCKDGGSLFGHEIRFPTFPSNQLIIQFVKLANFYW